MKITESISGALFHRTLLDGELRVTIGPRSPTSNESDAILQILNECPAVRDALKHGAHQEWTLVEDGLPRDGVEVLTFDQWKINRICIHHEGHGWQMQFGGGTGGITHWRSLPNPPNSEWSGGTSAPTMGSENKQ